uniref:Uncharacterized protein n=1 Tax=Arundo donax TaxID=35708 RepID=A0A0A9C2C1_ARUDO
MRERARRGA